MRLADCHPSRKHKARGMCASCYESHLRSADPEYKRRGNARVTAWYRKNPARRAELNRVRKERELARPVEERRTLARERLLRDKYGITLADYDRLLVAQGDGCAICGRKAGVRPLHVDHCHLTGVVRGVLCHQCNWYMGTLEGGPDVLPKLLAYIGRHRPDLMVKS